MPRDLHELPRFGDGLSFLQIEHARIEQDAKSITAWTDEGIIEIPAAALAALLLGPGTTITHAAMRTLADNGCSVVWTGEGGVRTYASGLGETRQCSNLLRQAWLATHEQARRKVVAHMYRMRFPGPLPPDLTIQQIRGMEGIRVRDTYAQASREHGIEWSGRNYDRGNWGAADPVNRALSTANSCLYGLVHAAIVSCGYSPALGFIHTGKMLSFVYDIADLYKCTVSIPVAFSESAHAGKGLERRVRLAMRDRMGEIKLLQRIPADIARALSDAPEETEEAPPKSAPPNHDGRDDPYAQDASKPSPLWDPSAGPNTPLTDREGPF